MSPLRRTLALRRRELRRAMAVARTQAWARLQQQPAVQQEQARRRRRRLLLLLLLLLVLLLFARCDCAPEPAPLPEPEPVAVVPKQLPPVVPKVQTRRRPLAGHNKTLARPAYDNDAVALPSWLPEFRLQVAARSPRLAACFNGSSRPGAWRWGAAVHARTGVVSDHTLEPLAGSSVSAVQRACLLGVLSEPRYGLVVDDEDDVLPRRVGLLIEF